LVSQRTYIRHRKQQISEGALLNSGSDGDDDDSDAEGDDDSDTDRDNSSGTARVLSIPPLLQVASPAMSESEGGHRLPSPYPRQQRTPSSPETSRISSSPDRSPPHFLGSGAVIVEPAPSVDPPQVVENTPSVGENEGISPPPREESSPSTDEESLFEDGIFSNFDIEDLLYAGQIEVEPWLKLGLVLLRWKSRKNISTHAYDDLRHNLADCLKIKVPSARTILTHLKEIVGISPVKLDCCANGCLAYVGRYRRAKNCATCGAQRYQVAQENDDTMPDVNPDDSDLSDSETYQDDLDENNQRRAANKSFLYIPLIPRLARLWADPSMATTMKEYRKDFVPFCPVPTGSIQDFWDGRVLKDYLMNKEAQDCKLFHTLTDTALQLSIDGVSMVTDRSYAHTTTPVVMQILNLPPHLRFKRQHKILCMLLPGPHEPKELASWLRPLWREMRSLHRGVRALDGSLVRQGSDVLEDPHLLYNEAAFFTLRAYITLVVGDQVAMNSLGCFKGAGSKRSCRMCWLEGIRPAGSTIYYPVHQVNTDLLSLPLRNDLPRVARDICNLGSETARKEAGIKGLSFLLQLPLGSVQYPFAIP
jgi:hypothetical protein